VTAARHEYDGPITLRLSQPGFSLTNNVIPAKTNSTQIKVAIPSDLQPGKLINFYVFGEAQIGDATVQERASTLAALRKSFPNQLYPPTELDGLIGLGVVAGKTTDPEVSEKRAKE
jgi:hypothetical protein